MNDELPRIIDKYLRISESYDGSTRSVDDQDADGTATILERGYRVGETFRDPFKSGWRKGVVRKDFELMIARARAGLSQGVWVYDVTRFSRKPAEGELLLDLATGGFLVLSEDGTYDLSRADGRKRFRDALAQAAYESDKISERVTRGKRKKAEVRGRSNAARRCFGMEGHEPRPAGWRRDGTPPTPVPAEQVAREADAVRHIVRLILSGKSGGIFAAVEYLNANGFRTTMGNPFYAGAVSDLLKVPALAGLVVYKGRLVPDRSLPGDPVISRDDWDRLQVIFAGRRRGPKGRRYLLTGDMYCGECGKALAARPVRNVRPYGDGSIAREYLCQKYPGRGGCYRVAIDQRYADQLVGAMTVARLATPEHLAVVAAKMARAAETSGRRAEIEAQIGALELEVEDATRRGAEKGWKLARIEAFCEPTDRQIARLRKELDALGEEPAYFAAVNAERQWLEAGGPLPGHAWSGDDWADLDTLKRMVREAFPRLTVRRGSAGRGRGELRADRFAWDGIARD